jgi:hypothetical protein
VIWGQSLDNQTTGRNPSTVRNIIHGVTIETNVPIPTPETSRHNGITAKMTEVLRNMTPGDSFIAPKRTADLAFCAARSMGLMIKTRVLPGQEKIPHKEKHVRVWLIGPNPDAKKNANKSK